MNGHVGINGTPVTFQSKEPNIGNLNSSSEDSNMFRVAYEAVDSENKQSF